MIWVYWVAVKELALSNYSAGIYPLWYLNLSFLTNSNPEYPGSRILGFRGFEALEVLGEFRVSWHRGFGIKGLGGLGCSRARARGI